MVDDEIPLTEIPLTAISANSVQEAELLFDIAAGYTEMECDGVPQG